eukprot:TRINITY_DN0_c1634_g1_i1.p1 TRINITY_DN0_c1634_g1~~TRINITY_DN0_c1634_g1_i1.p1  ORF type:complete len:190 (+),score=17.03 TRINITY_DN0_c1634_g1_i1:55-624(+)
MPPSKNCQVYVAGIPRKAGEDYLRDAFKDFGKIKEVAVKQGYGFVTFSESKEAEEAVEKMHDKELDGRKIIVEFAGERKRATSRGPQAEDKCYNCGKTGHWANECRDSSSRHRSRRRRRSSSRSSSSSSRSRSRRKRKSHKHKKHRSPSSSRSSRRSSRSRSRSRGKSGRNGEKKAKEASSGNNSPNGK